MAMKANLFIHGVPLGAKFWKEEDKEYFGMFYTSSCKDKIRFFIQVHLSNGIPYCYYNYLVYDGVVDNQGREGSYFGITLRLDAYCKDCLNIYRILDYCYNVYILGDILKSEGGKLKYVRPDFLGMSEKFKGIETLAINLLKQGYKGSYESLKGFALQSDTYFGYNLYDCTQENVRQMVQSKSCIAISPYYPNKVQAATIQQYEGKIQAMEKERQDKIQATIEQYESKINSIRKAFDEKIREKDELFSQIRSENQSLKSNIASKKEEINSLKSKVSTLEANMNKAGKIKKISQIVAKVEQPIEELAALFRAIAPATIPVSQSPEVVSVPKDDEKQKKRSRSYFKLALIIENIILLIFIVIMLTFCDREDVATMPIDDTQTKEISQQTNEDQAMESQASGGEKKKETQSTPKDIKIDIIDYDNSSDLKIGHKYTVKAKNVADKGEWKVKGCTMENGDDSNTIIITPKEKNVEIEYHVNNWIKSRKLKAK